MLKHVRRGAALILSMAMFIQLGIGNNYITFASEETQTPEQTQEESQTTGEVLEESNEVSSDTQESTEPAPETEEEVTVPEKEAASTLIVQFVNEDKTNIDVNQYPDKEIALTGLYVNDPYQLVFNDHQINTRIEGYTLSKIVDAEDTQKEYPLTTIEQGYVDISLSKNITKIQLVYTKDVVSEEPTSDGQNQETGEVKQPVEGEEDSEEADRQEIEEENSENQEVSKDENVSLPEQVLSTVASDGATITIMAPEGSLPEGVSVVAQPIDSNLVKTTVENAIKSEGRKLLNYKAYDITIYSKAGNIVQPKKAIQISILNAGVVGEKSVYHLSDSAKQIEKVEGMTYGNIQMFSASHFSIYVVAGSETIEPGDEDLLTVTINFVYENGVIANSPYIYSR